MASAKPSSEPLVGVIYGRQSRTKDESESLDTQTKVCQGTAEQFGVEIQEVILEPPSTGAYKKRGRQRPRFPELIELLRSGDINVIASFKTDRLSRGGGPGWAPLLDAAEEAGLDLDHFVLIPGSGFMSEFEIGIRAAMDREESKKTSERVRALKDRHAAEGRPSGRNNCRPYGFAEDWVTVVPAEAALIREAAERYLAGESTGSIALSWNKRGIPTSSGKEWSGGTLRNTLAAPRITGLRQHRGEVVGEATWPAILDRGVWVQIQGRLRSRSHQFGPAVPRKRLLRGLTVCNICSGKMRVTHDRSGTLRIRCRKEPGRRNCGRVSMSHDPVEHFVIAQALYRLDSPAVEAARRGRVLAAEEVVPDIASQYGSIEAKLKELAQDYAADRITRPEWFDARTALIERRDGLDAELARASDNKAMSSLGEGHIADLWPDLPFERQYAILNAIIAEVRISPAAKPGSPKVDLSRVEVVWRA